MNQLSDTSSWPDLYGDYLFSIAVYKVNNHETAEDLVQETFFSAIKAKDSFRGTSTEKTWLTTILNNKVIDYYRKKDILKTTDTYLIETDDSFYDSFFDVGQKKNGHWLSSAAPSKWAASSADAGLDTKEFFKILQFCLEKIPDRLTSVFVLKFIEEKDASRICKELNLTSSNYWVIIHRAKLLIRSCLEKNWFGKKT